MGINAEPLAVRLMGEQRYVDPLRLTRMLGRHNPTKDVPLPEPGAERKQRVQREVEQLIACVCRNNRFNEYSYAAAQGAAAAGGGADEGSGRPRQTL